MVKLQQNYSIICIQLLLYGYFPHIVPGEPPQNVQARNESSTTISVDWESPPQEFLFGILRGYIIRYVPVTEMDIVNSTELIPPNRNSFTLENLLEFTNYSIEVTAVTGAGEGPYSTPVYVVTNPDSELPEFISCNCGCFYLIKICTHACIHSYRCFTTCQETSYSYQCFIFVTLNTSLVGLTCMGS